MKLVLHRRVHSDVDEIMNYYERAERPELARTFIANCGVSCWTLSAGPTDTISSKRTSGG
jgi:plasmid stabilization system protein ParE